jgi:AcrR family transcriptional regulator
MARAATGDPAQGVGVASATKDGSSQDGRHLRSIASRERILRAMLDLIREGNPDPRAEDVAARAGVGLRTVFRLFSDMESICAEMLVPQRLEFVACFTQRFVEPRGAARLRELYLRLARLYEARMPLRRAGMIRRYSSPSLAGAMRELDATIAAFIELQIPETEPRARERRQMLNLLMSYEAWMRLRDSQGLDAEATRALLLQGIEQQLA